jgi:hypothetical protein
MKHLIEGNKKENYDIRVNKEEKIKNKLRMNGIKKESNRWKRTERSHRQCTYNITLRSVIANMLQ